MIFQNLELLLLPLPLIALGVRHAQAPVMPLLKLPFLPPSKEDEGGGKLHRLLDLDLHRLLLLPIVDSDGLIGVFDAEFCEDFGVKIIDTHPFWQIP